MKTRPTMYESSSTQSGTRTLSLRKLHLKQLLFRRRTFRRQLLVKMDLPSLQRLGSLHLTSPRLHMSRLPILSICSIPRPSLHLTVTTTMPCLTCNMIPTALQALPTIPFTYKFPHRNLGSNICTHSILHSTIQLQLQQMRATILSTWRLEHMTGPRSLILAVRHDKSKIFSLSNTRAMCQDLLLDRHCTKRCKNGLYSPFHLTSLLWIIRRSGCEYGCTRFEAVVVSGLFIDGRFVPVTLYVVIWNVDEAVDMCSKWVRHLSLYSSRLQ